MTLNTKHKELLIICSLLLFMLPFVIQLQIIKERGLTPKTSKIEANIMKSILRGKTLFKKENCNSCHKPDKKQEPYAFRLRNISERYTNEFLTNFIRNEDSLVKAKNPIVINLKEEYNWANGLHNKKHLSKREILDILNYLNSF